MTAETGAMIAETDARRTTDPLGRFDSLRALAADAGFLGRACQRGRGRFRASIAFWR